MVDTYNMDTLRTAVLIICVFLLASLLYGVVSPGAADQAHQNAVEYAAE